MAGDLHGKIDIETGAAQKNVQALSKTAKDLIKTLQSMNQVATSKDVKGVGGEHIKDSARHLTCTARSVRQLRITPLRLSQTAECRGNS